MLRFDLCGHGLRVERSVGIINRRQSNIRVHYYLTVRTHKRGTVQQT